MVEQYYHQGLEVLHQKPRKPVLSRPPLVFLHGAFAGAWIWAANYLPWFARHGWEAYAISFRGHGTSAGAAELHEFGVADYAEDALSLLRSLDRPAVLVGHSMGGFVAQRIIGLTAIRAYVLMASVPPMGLSGPAITLAWCQPWLLNRLFEIQCLGMATAGPETLRQAFFHKDLPGHEAAGYLGRIQDESLRATLELYLPVMVELSCLRRVPSLVMGGLEDRLIAAFHIQQTAALLGQSAGPVVRDGACLDVGAGLGKRRPTDPALSHGGLRDSMIPPRWTTASEKE